MLFLYPSAQPTIRFFSSLSSFSSPSRENNQKEKQVLLATFEQPKRKRSITARIACPTGRIPLPSSEFLRREETQSGCRGGIDNKSRRTRRSATQLAIGDRNKVKGKRCDMRGIVGLEENEPRLPFYLSPFSPGPVSFPHRQSLSYSRLPVHLIKLTVLKLDGTSFDVHVSREASVWELKMAVEEIFGQSQNGANEDISWSHVWGQFCLSYGGLKLIEEKALLKNFGIKDCDQLQFIRHLSVIGTATKHQRRGHVTNAEWRRKSWAGVELIDFEFEESATVNNRNRELTLLTNKDTSQSPDQQEAIICGEEELLVLKNHSQSKLSRCLKDWLCYSSQVYTKRPSSECSDC